MVHDRDRGQLRIMPFAQVNRLPNRVGRVFFVAEPDKYTLDHFESPCHSWLAATVNLVLLLMSVNDLIARVEA